MIGVLALILIVLLIVLGGERGSRSAVALLENIVFFSAAMILMSAGCPPMAVVLVAGAAISYGTIIGQNGKNKKTVAALTATMIVMLVLGTVIWIFLWKSGGGGLNEIQASQDDVSYYYNVNIGISMLQAAVSAVLLSTLGAVMDTALSVTSSVYEVWRHCQNAEPPALAESGFQVGRAIIGTTVNTLLFAYLGESILLFLYLKTGRYSVEMILNSKFLFQGLTSMLFGAVACLLTVPVSIACIIRRIEYDTTKKTG